MIRHPIQVVTVRGYLRAGIVGRVHLRAGAVDAGRERRRHVVGEVQALQREVDVLFDLVGERAFEREALEVDEQHGRQSRKRERLGRFAQRFAPRAVPGSSACEDYFFWGRADLNRSPWWKESGMKRLTMHLPFP